MHLREPLPDFPTVDQLRDWMAQSAPSLRQELTRQNVCAPDLTWPIHDSPNVRTARASWQNPRPFPSDEEIVVLMVLLAPRDQEINDLDEQSISVVISMLLIMAAPDPLPAQIQVDLCRRSFTMLV